MDCDAWLLKQDDDIMILNLSRYSEHIWIFYVLIDDSKRIKKWFDLRDNCW